MTYQYYLICSIVIFSSSSLAAMQQEQKFIKVDYVKYTSEDTQHKITVFIPQGTKTGLDIKQKMEKETHVPVAQQKLTVWDNGFLVNTLEDHAIAHGSLIMTEKE